MKPPLRWSSGNAASAASHDETSDANNSRLGWSDRGAETYQAWCQISEAEDHLIVSRAFGKAGGY
jgi:hypothetical protein